VPPIAQFAQAGTVFPGLRRIIQRRCVIGRGLALVRVSHDHTPTPSKTGTQLVSDGEVRAPMPAYEGPRMTQICGQNAAELCVPCDRYLRRSIGEWGIGGDPPHASGSVYQVHGRTRRASTLANSGPEQPRCNRRTCTAHTGASHVEGHTFTGVWCPGALSLWHLRVGRCGDPLHPRDAGRGGRRKWAGSGARVVWEMAP